MIYLVHKTCENLVVYDSDDETIEYCTTDEILLAYKSGVVIFGFDDVIYESLAKFRHITCSDMLHGVRTANKNGKIYVRFGAYKMFQSLGMRINNKYDMIINRYEDDIFVEKLDIYFRGWLYEFTLSLATGDVDVSDKDGNVIFKGNNMSYFGYDIENDCVVVFLGGLISLKDGKRFIEQWESYGTPCTKKKFLRELVIGGI